MTPLRITVVTTGLQTGGAESMLFNLLANLGGAQFAPTVVSLREPEHWRAPIERLGIPVLSVGMEPSRPTPGALARLRALVRASAPDLLQGWMYHGNIAAVAARSAWPAPVCWSIHHSIYALRNEKPLTGALIGGGALLSRVPARIFYVSHVSRAQHERLGYRAARGEVIPNGVDTGLFQPLAPDARAAVRAELGVPPAAPLIGLIARFHAQKDHATFLQAAALAARAHPELRVLLAGRDTGPENAALRALVDAAGLTGRVLLLGERRDVPRLTAALDLACSSSVFGEALSLALIEALACGVPCVVTDVGDSARLVGPAGLAVPARDAAAFAQALRQLLAAGPATRAALGQLARQRAIREYRIQHIAGLYASVYDDVCGRPGRHTTERAAFAHSGLASPVDRPV